MQRASETVTALLEPTVTSMGYQFIGAEFGQGENGQTLRVYIDHADGITVDDCGLVSRQVSSLLDVEDVIPGAYLLEVSSPGVDRPLFTPEQFAEQVGVMVKVRLSRMVSGQRRFTGQLTAATDEKITLEFDGQESTLFISDVESAHVVPNFRIRK